MTRNRRFLALIFIVNFSILVNIKNNDKNPRTNRRNKGEKKIIGKTQKSAKFCLKLAFMNTRVQREL